MCACVGFSRHSLLQRDRERRTEVRSARGETGRDARATFINKQINNNYSSKIIIIIIRRRGYLQHDTDGHPRTRLCFVDFKESVKCTGLSS